MTLTQNGLDYICQNFGDENECCVNQGLQWQWEDIDHQTGTEEGGTAQVVSRLIFPQLILKITMLNPPRGDFTYSQLRAANSGQDVTLNDCDSILQHDEPSEEQWCYTIIPCTEGATKCIGNDLYTCQDGTWVLTEQNSPECITIPCSDYLDKEPCETNGCYWYSDLPPFLPPTCHSKPEDEMRKYLIYGGIALVGFAVVVLIIKKISGRQPYYPPPPGR